MKILDVLKSLGIKPEDDINTIVGLEGDGESQDGGDTGETQNKDTETETDTKDTKDTGDKKESTDTKDEKDDEVTKDTKDEKDESLDNIDSTKIFDDGWFNADTNAIDFTKISNSEVAEALKMLDTKYIDERNNRLISDELNNELSNYSLNVSEDTLKKVLSMTDVKIDDKGKVIGVKEAIDNLKSTEPGFFKETKAEENPLVKEGFNPVEKTSTTNLNSFSEAFRVMDEIN